VSGVLKSHRESHRVGRSGWLRAAVLGANDGLISTSSLLFGMAIAGTGGEAVLMAGFGALVAGSLSMAAGEYVSVSSQSDSERADLARERRELQLAPEAEHRELAGIYMERGLPAELADQVARAMMSHDALGAHARDELGIFETTRARPVQAALTSAASFAAGALPPLLLVLLLPLAQLPRALPALAVVLLLALGALAASLGGATVWRGAVRVTFWGLLAMACTGVAGHLFGLVTT
jgi:VIT1/CCC1 family predicted Fe2+/Mn2+ transporter